MDIVLYLKLTVSMFRFLNYSVQRVIQHKNVK